MTFRSAMLSLFAAVTLFATASSAQEAHVGHHGAFKAACGADVQKSCPDARRGKAVFECLKSHDSDLSDTCKAFLAQHHHESGAEPVHE